MEEIKREVAEKNEFEYQDKSKIIALIRNFGLPRLRRKVQNRGFFN